MTIQTITQPEALWAELRSALTNFDRVLNQIIETRAWEPLGYSTFAEAWTDRMRGVRLGTAAMAAQVVYAMIDSGLNRQEALVALGPSSGVGPATYDTLARQHDVGVLARDATTRVRAHRRNAPSEARVVHVELTPTEYLHFRAVADSRGLDLGDEAAKAIRSHFRQLERRLTRGDD